MEAGGGGGGGSAPSPVLGYANGRHGAEEEEGEEPGGKGQGWFSEFFLVVVKALVPVVVVNLIGVCVTS